MVGLYSWSLLLVGEELEVGTVFPTWPSAGRLVGFLCRHWSERPHTMSYLKQVLALYQAQWVDISDFRGQLKY